MFSGDCYIISTKIAEPASDNSLQGACDIVVPKVMVGGMNGNGHCRRLMGTSIRYGYLSFCSLPKSARTTWSKGRARGAENKSLNLLMRISWQRRFPTSSPTGYA